MDNELADLVAKVGSRYPGITALRFREPVLPLHVYRYVLDFLASEPGADQIANFRPTPQMAERLRTLLAREKQNEVTPFGKRRAG